MKKYLFMAAVAGLTLTSCSQDDLGMPNQGNQNEITFAAPVVGKMTRAFEVGNNYPTAADYNFAVWAYYFTGNYSGISNGTLYMNEVEMQYDGSSTWAPKHQKYFWPKNGTLTFFGYSPASVAGNASYTGDGKISFTDYEVSTDRSQQVDLLFSERSYNQRKYTANASDKTTDDKVGTGSTSPDPTNPNDPYTGAHLVFKHALSSLIFNVKTDKDYVTDNQTEITLTGLTLNNVVSKGTFVQNIGDTNGDQTVAPRVDDNLGNDWTLSAEKANYTVFPNVSNEATSFLLNTTAYWPVNNANVADAPKAYTAGLRSTDLMLIPQPLTGITLTVNYTIKSKDSSAIPQVSTINLTAPSGHGNAWDWGYRYIYTITIGLENISIEPYVTGWQDVHSDSTI